MLDINKLPNMKVLIVDDLSDNLKVLYNTLNVAGYNISMAKTGQQALNHINDHQPDLILLDITLPDINGLDVCRTIKLDKTTEKIPVIFISASTDTGDVVKGFEAGCVDYICKPFVEAEVLARVKTHLTLKCLHENLEHRVAERTAALEKAKTLAETANQAKTQFLTRMTHEFKTPLNSILGFAQLLEQQVLAGEMEELLTSRDYIIDSGKHLLRLVDDILDIANIENQQLKLSLENISVDEVIKTAINSVKDQADDSAISISFTDSKLKVVANKDRLIQVITNLLSNAIKFNFDKGLVNIEVQLIDQRQIEISIKDTGVGIVPEEEENLFMPFTRLSYAEEQGIPGIGLGLSQSRYLVSEMNGHIKFHSQVGQGSVFSVRLPQANEKKI
jgi:two-component system, sensor histidine kinase and response regulator